jgi:hypothetical protein
LSQGQPAQPRITPKAIAKRLFGKFIACHPAIETQNATHIDAQFGERFSQTGGLPLAVLLVDLPANLEDRSRAVHLDQHKVAFAFAAKL